MSFEHKKRTLSYKRCISNIKYELLNILSNTDELRDNIITTQRLVLTKDRKNIIVSFSSLFGNINKVARLLYIYSNSIGRALYARINLKGFPRLTFIPASKN